MSTTILTRLHCREENTWADVPTECCYEAFRGKEVSMRWRHTEKDGVNDVATTMREPSASSSPQLFLRGSVLHVKGTQMFVSASGLLAQISTESHDSAPPEGGGRVTRVTLPSIGEEVTLRIFVEAAATPLKQNQSRKENLRETRRTR